jgi:hypothetical protein
MATVLMPSVAMVLLYTVSSADRERPSGRRA